MNRSEKINEILLKLQNREIDRFNAVLEIEKLLRKKDVIVDQTKMGLVEEISSAFHKFIHPIRSIPDKASSNIINRLKSFTKDECIRAIINFSQDEWNMQNNGHRSLEWFFDKDSRVETYLGMKPKGKEETGILIGRKMYNTVQELIEAEKKGEIYYDDRKRQYIEIQGPNN